MNAKKTTSLSLAALLLAAGLPLLAEETKPAEAGATRVEIVVGDVASEASGLLSRLHLVADRVENRRLVARARSRVVDHEREVLIE